MPRRRRRALNEPASNANQRQRNMSTYPPDPACAAELEKAATPNAKRSILEHYGWSCSKKGDRWTYKKGDGREIKSLTTLVKELSNDDPFASGSDNDEKKAVAPASDANAANDAFFGVLGPNVDLDAAALEEARKVLVQLPVNVATLIGVETAVALRRAQGVPAAPVVLDVLRTELKFYNEVKAEQLPSDLKSAIDAFQADKGVLLYDVILPRVTRDLLELPEAQAVDALQQMRAGYSSIRTPSAWLRKKVAEFSQQVAEGAKPPETKPPETGIDVAKGLLVQVMGPIGRQDVLDTNLEVQLGLLTDDAALAYAQYVRGQDPRVLWGLGPGLQAWLLEGISNGAKREVVPSSKKREKKKSRRRSRSRSRSRSRKPRKSRSRSSSSRSRSRSTGGIRPVYEDVRVTKKARQILRKCHESGTLGQWELDGHTVAALCSLKKEHQIEVSQQFQSMRRDKIKNLNGWLMGGIRRCLNQQKQRSRSRSRGRRRRSRSRSKDRPRPGGAKANEAFFAKLEGHVKVGEEGIDQKTFQTLAVAVERMDARLAEKCGKSCARRLKRGAIPSYGEWLVECAGRALKDRDAKPRGALMKRLEDLRVDFGLREDAFASGTLRDLGWLLPRQAALSVVDMLRLALDKKPTRDADEALDDAVSDRLQAQGGADEKNPPSLPPRRQKPADDLGVVLPEAVARAFMPLRKNFNLSRRDLGRPNLVALKNELTEAEAAQVLELLHVAFSKKRGAPNNVPGWVRESIQKHIAKRALIKQSSPRAAAAVPRPFGRSPRDKPAGEMCLSDAVAEEWARVDRKHRCGPCPRKIVGDLAKLLKEHEAIECVKNFGAELKKAPNTDPVKFIFNDSRRIYYSRTDRSSSRSPGAPRRKKAKTAPADRSSSRSPGAPRRKKARAAPAPAEADRSSSRSPGAPRRKTARTAPAPASAEDSAKLDALLDG